jgi:glycerophosphoryl diester phosphodiesterase
MNNTIKVISGNKPKMVAHRGVSGLEKENTHAAFIAAGNRSYWGVETDVHRTVDGRYVCIHDAATQRVGIDNVNVEECTYETVRNLQLCEIDGKKGRTDIRIPSLQEYIQICRHYDKTPVLELKGNYPEDQIREICNIVANEGYLDRTVFIAFDLNNLILVRRVHPEQTVQYLIGKHLEGMMEALDENNFDLDIYFGSLTKELVDQIHAKGHKINVWTVNTLEDAQKVIELGVDFITSNILE